MNRGCDNMGVFCVRVRAAGVAMWRLNGRCMQRNDLNITEHSSASHGCCQMLSSPWFRMLSSPWFHMQLLPDV
jgi:hypothetical protein